ncbi:MAG: hypothetical protein P1U82_22100 [Verrucomicrobiales bacterium]|nr:hypothetical protein [Verrucomicrobiales bacterium]
MAEAKDLLQPSQQKIHDRLAQINSRIANIYLGMHYARQDKENPEWFYQVCHSARELANAMSRLSGIRRQTTVSKEKDGMVKRLTNVFDPLGGVAYERKVYADWNEVHTWFTKFSHHPDLDTSEALLDENIERLEELLGTYILPSHLDSHDRIDTLLSRGPDHTDIEELRRWISRSLADYTHFLRNADGSWFGLLNRHQFFNKVPPPEVDGQITAYYPWEPSAYLARIAPVRAIEVQQHIMRNSWQNSKNPHVLTDFVRAMTRTGYVKGKFVDKMQREAWYEQLSHSSFFFACRDYLNSLLNNDSHYTAAKLLRFLLTVRSGDRHRTLSYDRSHGYLDPGMIREIIRIVEGQTPSDNLAPSIKVLLNQLEAAIAIDLADEAIRGEYLGDGSEIWAETLKGDDEQEDDLYFLGSIKPLMVRSLLRMLRQFIEAHLSSDEESEEPHEVSDLEERFERFFSTLPPRPIFRRFRLHFYCQYPELFATCSAASLVEDFGDQYTEREYGLLAHQMYPSLDIAAKTMFIALIERGPAATAVAEWRDSHKRWHSPLGREARPVGDYTIDVGDEEEPAESKESIQTEAEYVEQRLRRWKAYQYANIKDHLSPKQLERFGNLSGENEPLPAWSHNRFGIQYRRAECVKEVPVEELAALTLDEIAQKHLTRKPRRFGETEMEEVRNSLREALRQNASEYSGQLCVLLNHDIYPSVIPSILNELRNEVRNGSSLVWEQVLAFGKQLLELHQAGPPEPERNEEGEISDHRPFLAPDYALARYLFVLAEGLNFSDDSKITADLGDRAFAQLLELHNHPNPTLEEEAEFLEGNFTPFDASLNTVRSAAVHLLFAYWRWKIRIENSGNPLSLVDLPEVRGVLDYHVSMSSEPSMAVRSVYGLHLKWIHFADVSWLSENSRNLFPAGRSNRLARHSVWQGYLGREPCIELLSQLEPHFLELCDDLPVLDKKKALDHAILNRVNLHTFRPWLVFAENQACTRIGRRYLERAEATHRWRSISGVGNYYIRARANRAEEEALPTKESLEEFWTARLEQSNDTEELKAFGHWYDPTYFDLDWLINQVEKTLEASEGRLSKDSEIFKSFFELALDRPEQIACCVQFFVTSHHNRFRVLNPNINFYGVLERCQRSGNQAAQQHVRQAVNYLVSIGETSYRNIVREG